MIIHTIPIFLGICYSKIMTPFSIGEIEYYPIVADSKFSKNSKPISEDKSVEVQNTTASPSSWPPSRRLSQETLSSGDSGFFNIANQGSL